MNEKRYWLLIGGLVRGPYSATGVRDYLKAGVADTKTPCKDNSSGQWFLLEQLLSSLPEEPEHVSFGAGTHEPLGSAPPAAGSSETKKCPDCAETVRGEARVCRFCGYHFGLGKNPRASPAPVQTAPPIPEGAVPSHRPKTETDIGWAFALVILVFFGALAAIQIFYPPLFQTLSQSPKEREGTKQAHDAYYAAEKFIREKYPGAKTVSAFEDSAVQHGIHTWGVAVSAETEVERAVELPEGAWRVDVKVDGLNAFGGPVRKRVTVKMELEGNKWRLLAIQQDQE